MHKPLRSFGRRGVTLVELVVGIAVAGVLALITAGLFKAGLESYDYSYRQGYSIFAACRGFAGNGSKVGLIWSAQEAKAVSALSASSLALLSPSGTAILYTLSGNELRQTNAGVQELQAKPVTAVSFDYYNLDSQERIMVSTAPEAATLVTARLKVVAGYGARAKTYNFMSGARLHNNQ